MSNTRVRRNLTFAQAMLNAGVVPVQYSSRDNYKKKVKPKSKGLSSNSAGTERTLGEQAGLAFWKEQNKRIICRRTYG